MTVRNLKIDATTGDLVLDGANLALVSDEDSIEQAVRIRLKTFLGEWFLDQEGVGLPYFEDILIKNPNPSRIRGIFRDEILAVPGVLDLTTLTLDLDREERTLSIEFAGTTDTGEFSSTVEVVLS